MTLLNAPIAAVLLDLDDTILHDDQATQAAFAATAEVAREQAGVDPNELIAAVLRESAALWAEGPHPEWTHGIGTDEVEGLRSRFAGEHPHWVAMREWGPAFRHESWRRALASCGVEDDGLASELDARFDAERAATNPLIEGAEEALGELRKHYRLAMVTNGIPDVQRTKIERASLAEYFELLIVSGELGYGKPEARIYEETARQLGVAPEACIMVGDNFRRDVVGAQEAGIRGVWISMGRPMPESPVTPWLTVTSLAELPDRLAEMFGPA
ncbi:MAG TPA: HAD family hydrolase [Thermomicrobiales bacterium]|nr:HAD family hydrolase [Thermomicrobiales bacterium]